MRQGVEEMKLTLMDRKCINPDDFQVFELDCILSTSQKECLNKYLHQSGFRRFCVLERGLKLVMPNRDNTRDCIILSVGILLGALVAIAVRMYH